MTALARGVLRRPTAAVSAAWLCLVLVSSVGAPLFAPHGPLDQDLTHVLSGPSSGHLLGTDALGRDILSRLLYGGQSTLLGVVEALLVYLLLGITFGLAAGYLGGWVDWVVTRTAELMFALPGIIIVLVVLSVFPDNLSVAMITFGALGSPGLVRLLRAQTLSVREELYVASARVSGLAPAQILRRHILPRMISMVIVQAALCAAIVVTIQAGLGFLGFGIQPPNPSWGGLVADASNVIDTDPWMLVPAGVPLVLTVIALGLLGDAIRDSATANWSVSTMAPPRAPAASPARATADSPAAAPADPDPEALLSVRGLSIEISGTVVVQDVSFDLMPGQTMGVVGESGCGKSVTALGVLGLVPGGGRISAGRCLFEGRDLAALSPAELAAVRGSGIAFVSQEPMVALDPTFTVSAQLAEAVRRHRGLSRKAARSRVLELLSLVNIPDPAAVAGRYPHQLSGGMAQRIAIALALAGEPRLLIADEPTTALDVTVQAEILALLRTLQARTGMSVLIVTHDWGVVADLCDRAVVMYAGQVVEYADVSDMFHEPHHPYTLGLLAANPHLAVEGEPLPTIPGTVPAPRDWPSGCRFTDRCPYATAECSAGPVPLVQQQADRLSRCLHTDRLVPEGGRR